MNLVNSCRTHSIGCGQEWIRTTEVERQRIYSPPHLAALEPARYVFLNPMVCSVDGAREGTRTPDQLITNQLLYQLSYSGLYRLEKLILTYLPGKVDK